MKVNKPRSIVRFRQKDIIWQGSILNFPKIKTDRAGLMKLRSMYKKGYCYLLRKHAERSWENYENEEWLCFHITRIGVWSGVFHFEGNTISCFDNKEESEQDLWWVSAYPNNWQIKIVTKPEIIAHLL